MASTFTKLFFHVVFSTKDRRPLITPQIQDELYNYIGGIIRGERGSLIEVGGARDHVHLLLRMSSDISLADMVRRIKANSNRWANRRFERQYRFGWQVGYSAFSVSESGVPQVRRYIQNQEKHHRRASFRDELVALLERHGLAWNERFLLG